MTNRGRLEDGIQALILISVAGMAGAASFTHVHDWTMHNSPTGTGDWFGWANAMVSELIPLAAGLEVRRRRATNTPVGRYPITLILAAVALSLAGQFAEAKPGLSGWLISAVPALGFMALVKLVLSGPTNPTDTSTGGVDIADAAPPAGATTPIPSDTGTARPEPRPATPDPASVELPAHLLTPARFAIVNHEQTTGRPITPTELATRMSLPEPLAGHLLTALTNTPVNGHPVVTGR